MANGNNNGRNTNSTNSPARGNSRSGQWSRVFSDQRSISVWKWATITIVITIALKYLPWVKGFFSDVPLWQILVTVAIIIFVSDNVLRWTCLASDFCTSHPFQEWKYRPRSTSGWALVVMIVICLVLAFHLAYQHIDLDWDIDLKGFLGLADTSVDVSATDKESVSADETIELLRDKFSELLTQNKSLVAMNAELLAKVKSLTGSGEDIPTVLVEGSGGETGNEDLGPPVPILPTQKCWVKEPRNPPSCNPDLPCMTGTNRSLGITNQTADCQH